MYEKGSLTTPTQIVTMRKQLLKKTPGVLPESDKRLQSLILSHAELYDGFALLTQILLPYFPALCNGVRIGTPTWQGFNADIFLLQAHLVTFYTTEEASGREYTKMEKLRTF